MQHPAAVTQTREKIFLNVGCGAMGMDRVPDILKAPGWQQVRVDIDTSVQPDIVASFSDMHMINRASVDAVFSSHNIEHMPWHEAQLALQEAKRVLRPDGFVYITCPDLEYIARLIVDGKLMEVAYNSPAGPITALDMLYGHRDAMARGNDYMAHRSGFTAESLGRVLIEAGFADVQVARDAQCDLWAIASSQALSNELKFDFKQVVAR